MAYTPKFGKLPKDDEPINSASDEADRSIHEVEKENEKYYLEQKKIAEGVTRIQSGVRAGAAATLKRRSGEDGNVDILIGEKVQNELYKAVEGNDVYEPERGDNKNLEGSLSSEYMKSGKVGKWKMKGRRLVRGAFASLGADNMVEAEVVRRFGPQYRERSLVEIRGKKIGYETNVASTLEERKKFVLGRLRNDFIALENKKLLSFAEQVGVNIKVIKQSLDQNDKFRLKIIDEIFEKLAGFSTQELKALNIGALAFQDLILLTDIEQRESAKTGVEGVYDVERLHDFWNETRFGDENFNVSGKLEEYRLARIKNLRKSLEVGNKPILEVSQNFKVLKSLLLNLDSEKVFAFSNQLGLRITKTSIESNKDEVTETIVEQELEKVDLNTFIKNVTLLLKSNFSDELAVVAREVLASILVHRGESLDPTTLKVLKSNLGLERNVDIDYLIFVNNPEIRKIRKVDNPVFELGVAFEKIMKENSLWPLKDNPESLALMAQLEYRLKTINSDNYKSDPELIVASIENGEINEEKLDALSKAVALRDELEGINTEIKFDINKKEDNKNEKINELQKDLNKIGREIPIKYEELVEIRKRYNESRDEVARAESEIAALTDPNARRMAAEKRDLVIHRREDLVKNYESKYKDLLNTEDELKEKAAGLFFELKKIRRTAPEEVGLLIDIMKASRTSTKDIENELPEVNGELSSLLKNKNEEDWYNFKFKIDDVQGEINKFTPFQLLQRMLRREYLERRDPAHDPAHFHERAARYSLLTAAMRVQDVKNIDLNRNVNKKVAEHLRQWKIGKIYGKVASNLNLAGRKVGIELVEGDKESVSSMLEQIIQSDEAKFAVFRGIDKYTTPRDLRKMLYESGKEVSLETMEEFIAILENILEGVKRGDDKYLKTLMHGDWDLENLILTLQKFKIERWTQQYMDKVVASEGNREHALLDLLRERREEDEKINKEIHKNVKSPDAMWKRQLSKNAIKESLNEKILNSNEQIRATGMDQAKKEIADLENSIKDLDDGNSKKIAGLRKIEELKSNISRTERELTQSRDLYEKVEAFKETLEKGNLSRKEAKKLAAEMGLAQIYDKMGMNFRLQRYWKKTVAGLKKAGGWTWDKTKKVGSWTNAKFFNGETARKAFSLARKGATPITYPLGLAWKVGSFPVRILGRAMAGAASLPGGIWRQVSSSSMKSYLRDFPIDINFKKQKLENDKADLKESLAKAPYEWDKKRIMRKMNRIDEKIEELNEEMARASAKAAKLGLTI
ncbi:MAG: hypothetical protein ACRCZE_02930 [Candidatus Altimarinota bacterium]